MDVLTHWQNIYWNWRSIKILIRNMYIDIIICILDLPSFLVRRSSNFAIWSLVFVWVSASDFGLLIDKFWIGRTTGLSGFLSFNWRLSSVISRTSSSFWQWMSQRLLNCSISSTLTQSGIFQLSIILDASWMVVGGPNSTNLFYKTKKITNNFLNNQLSTYKANLSIIEKNEQE